MSISYLIEVAAPPSTSTTERGRILERFAKRFLQTQNYEVTEEVRLTATEVDLLCTERTTGERIFVECKAHRQTIPAEVLHKLLGNVTFRKYSAGWLITTYDLGKDAKGFEEEWHAREPNERRILQIYAPGRLVERLIAAKIITDPASLSFDRSKFRAGTEAVLILTKGGEYWGLPIIDQATGIRSSALLFDAATGENISNSSVFTALSETDTTITVPWVTSTLSAQTSAAKRLHSELESIVKVPMADNWADYRPARPADFIGRAATQTTIFQFFDAVRAKQTSTRLIALKAPSGWGKSSTVLKIVSKATNIRNRGKYFVYAVDSRAAATRRFPELAVATALKEAINAGFVDAEGTPEFGGSSSLFATAEMQAIAEKLSIDGKLICIFFDQFEELLSKAELADVFEEMRRVCSAIEEAQANVVVGFSWKTDGLIPTEHNAYHMWRSLADRRLEIELAPFNESEVALAIGRFVKELGKPLLPQIKRLLQDHCQGFPWLLKKLCVHILELSKSGNQQADILSRSINIQSLFKKDLEHLSSRETACLKQIAAESPAEFFKIALNFGDETVSTLIDKRLIIRSGTRLAIYWDIFKDYILTERIPFIPVTYIPQANFSRYTKALIYIDGKPELSYAELAEQMSLSIGATDNLVRDLVNIGHVEANRAATLIKPLFRDEENAIEIAYSFWKSHEIVKRLSAGKTLGEPFTEPEFFASYRESNKRIQLEDKTIHTYAQRTLSWLIGIGIIEQSKNMYSLIDSVRCPIKTFDDVKVRELRSRGIFFGEAPPEKVVPAFVDIRRNQLTRLEVENKHGRNTCYVLMSLGIMRTDGTCLITKREGTDAQIVANLAGNTATVKLVKEFIAKSPDISTLEVGQRLTDRLQASWSKGSQRRHGSALRKWTLGCLDQNTDTRGSNSEGNDLFGIDGITA